MSKPTRVGDILCINWVRVMAFQVTHQRFNKDQKTFVLESAINDANLTQGHTQKAVSIWELD